MTAFRLGVGGELVPRRLDELAGLRLEAIRAAGATALLTHLSDTVDEQRAGAAAARRRLDDAGLAVVQAAGFDLRLVEDRPRERAELPARAEAAFEAAALLGAEMVVTGCGSADPRGHYAPAAANHLAATRDRLADTLAGLAPLAEAAGVVLAVECHQLTTLDTPEHIAEVVGRAGSPYVRASFDPVNLVPDLPTLYDTGPFLRRLWDVCGPVLAASVHVKDITVTDDLVLHLAEVPPGRGHLDFPALWEICRRLPSRSALIVEHLGARDAVEALGWVRESCARSGLELEPA